MIYHLIKYMYRTAQKNMYMCMCMGDIVAPDGYTGCRGGGGGRGEAGWGGTELAKCFYFCVGRERDRR
jgi:hypothetical protein